MKEHYCINCGARIPRRAKICQECGFSMNLSAPNMESRLRGTKHLTLILTAIAFAFLIALSAGVYFIFRAAGEIRNARSRHRENVMDEERSAQEKSHPEFSMPEISMPEIVIPEIHFPEPPAAAFAPESYEIETDLTGETVLYVNIRYTNKAEEAHCFLTNFKITVQQDGEICRQTAGDPTRENHLLEDVQPDETVLISEAFVIGTEKETSVSVNAFFSGNKYLEETIIPHADGTVSAAE